MASTSATRRQTDGSEKMVGRDSPSPITVEGARNIEQLARKLQEERPRWLIDPRTSKRIGYWDLLTTIALLFTATVTPYEVSLLQAQFDVLFIVNRVVDTIFLIDIVVQFLLIRERKTSATHGTQWETNPRALAWGYLTSWFTLDLFSVLISGIDVYAVLLLQSGGESSQPGQEVSDSSEKQLEQLEKLVALKVLRVLRLFKLARLARSSRVFKRWESRIAIDYSVLSITKCLVGVCIASHWMACIWILQAHLGAATPMPSWLGNNGYCVESSKHSSGYVCAAPDAIYSASLYFCMMTVTSVGYGDIAATPHNMFEQNVCTILILMSSLL